MPVSVEAVSFFQAYADAGIQYFIVETLDAADTETMRLLLAPDMIDHTPISGPVVGREPGKQLIASFARAFPDTTFTVDLMVAEAD